MPSLEELVAIYHSNLFKPHLEAQKALQYLTSQRGLTEKTIRELRIGFAFKWDLLPEPAVKDPDEPAWKNENWKLRGKVICPINDEFGKPVALSCRGCEPDDKWWNTSFDKGNHIYLFDVARKSIFVRNMAILVEGQMDAVVARQSGVLNCCSLMSTNLGIRRISLLSRYCDHFCLCFDTDENHAGQTGRLKAIFELHKLGIGNISTLSLPIGQDPDEFLLKFGRVAFLGLIKHLSAAEIERAAVAYVKITKGAKNV